MHILYTRHQNARTEVASDTAAARLRFFLSSLKRILYYRSQLKGAELYLPALASLDLFASEAKKKFKEELRPRATNVPLTALEIDDMLGISDERVDFSQGSLASKLFMLQALAGGFRRGENFRFSSADVVAGNISLQRINQKTVARVRGKLPAPKAPLTLRVIARVRQEFNLELSADEERELQSGKLEISFTRLRTTCAAHLLYSGASVQDVRATLGHASLEMVVDHYLYVPIADVGEIKPPDYYGNALPFVVPDPRTGTEHDLSASCHLAFHMYLLQRFCRIVAAAQTQLAPNTLAVLQTIILEEAGVAHKSLPKRRGFSFAS
jgi:integrase